MKPEPLQRDGEQKAEERSQSDEGLTEPVLLQNPNPKDRNQSDQRNNKRFSEPTSMICRTQMLAQEVVLVPLPSSQDIRYRLDSQYRSREAALLLFQLWSDVRSRALSPKTRSNPEQLEKECSRSTVSSVTGEEWVSCAGANTPGGAARGPTCEPDSPVLPPQVFPQQDQLLLRPLRLQLLLQPGGQLQVLTGRV